MTTRHAGYVVTLETDVREDDAEAIINALRMVKGVLSVDPIEHDFSQTIAQSRAEHEITMRVYGALRTAGDE